MDNPNQKYWLPSKFELHNTFLFLFYNVFKEKMFTIQIEDGREAPLKSSIILRKSWKMFKSDQNSKSIHNKIFYKYT